MSHPQQSPRFTRETVEGGLAGKYCAFSEMVGNMGLLRRFYTPRVGLPPGMVGSGGCQSLPPHLLESRVVAEQYVPRHPLPIQNSVQFNTRYNVSRLPGPENTAGGPTEQ